METNSHQWRRRPAEVASWSIVLAITAGWLLFLFFQRGHPFDEAEHAHVGWLISQGRRPITDFFQHHQPLLWSVLALYYRVGFTGAGVLIWGRVLVVCSGIVSVWALWALGRSSEDSSRLMGFLGAAAFIGLTGFIPELFVIRPETIAAALFSPALVIWNAEGNPAMVAVAGALAGAAVYASPRFALLGGFFLLIGRNSVRRWLLLAAGGIAFVEVYTAFSGFGVEKIVFSLRFSSYLQSVGIEFSGRRGATWIKLVLVSCIALAALVAGLPKRDRTRGAALVAYVIAVFLACNHLAGLFRYAQAYAAFIVAVAIAAAWIGGRVTWAKSSLVALAPVTLAMLLLPAMLWVRSGRPLLDFLSTVRARDRLASMVPAGGTILVFTRDNPITIQDASYYGIPLSDGKNRLCRAVQGFESSGKAPANLQLPPCDFLKTLEDGKPYLVDASITDATSEPAKAQQILEKSYHAVSLGSGFPAFIQDDIERRVNAALAGQ